MQPTGKLALFDLDNTLIDRQAAFLGWTQHFARERSLGDAAIAWILELDRDGFASREEVFSPVRERYHLAGGVEELITEYRSSYPSFIASEPLVVAALARLREAGWRLAIVTNGPPSQHEKIDKAGLASSFDAYCVSSEMGFEKPDPRIFEEAARQCGAELKLWSEAWMVGDAPGPDVQGGASAGLRTIWMHRGRSWGQLELRPDATVGSLSEAVEVLLSSPRR
jgi:HAD superfamily hydrolase (TIGR01549 family)